jgi:hypothetical protein
MLHLSNKKVMVKGGETGFLPSFPRKLGFFLTHLPHFLRDGAKVVPLYTEVVMDEVSYQSYYATFTTSAERVQTGDSILLRWKVVGVDVPVSSTHLVSGVNTELCMIETIATHGEREVIFAHQGTFAFCLNATFGNGAKCVKEVRIVVEDSA